MSTEDVTKEFILDVLDTFGHGMGELISWRTDGEYAPVTFWVNCNDLFYWACSDCEDITPENMPILKQAFADLEEAYPDIGKCWAGELFAARVRGMRPQRPVLDKYDERIRPLFLAAGPERDPKSEG